MRSRLGLRNLSSSEPRGLGNAIASMLNEFDPLYLCRVRDPILMFESKLHCKPPRDSFVKSLQESTASPDFLEHKWV